MITCGKYAGRLADERDGSEIYTRWEGMPRAAYTCGEREKKRTSNKHDGLVPSDIMTRHMMETEGGGEGKREVI